MSAMKVVVVGGGAHGRVIIDILEKTGRFQLLGILDANLPVGMLIQGYKVLASDSDIKRIVEELGVEGVLLGIGDNWTRSRCAEAIRTAVPDIAFPNAIHPSAQISPSVTFGSGNVVMPNAVCNSNARVGDFCILNTGSILEHDCILGDYASFAPGVVVGGYSKFGPFAAICLGAHVINQITIGSHTVVGAGSTVLKDLPDNVVAYGSPARVIRTRQPHDRYF